MFMFFARFISILLFSEPFAAKKTAVFCCKLLFFVYLLSLRKQCVGISVLKRILSHVHKGVTYGVILHKSVFR